MKRNGATHEPVILPPATARRVEGWEALPGVAECSVCLSAYSPAWDGQDPSPERLPLCARCWDHFCHREAA